MMTRRRWLILLFAIILTLFLLKAFAFTVVEVKETAFSYRPAVEALAKLEGASLKIKRNGMSSRQEELELYHRLYAENPGTEQDLTAWSVRGGASPDEFSVRVKVRNYGDEASAEIPVTVNVSAKVGEYFVDQQAFMVARQHLTDTARWEPLQTVNCTIPILAPNQSYDVYCGPITFGAYLHSLENRFPVRLKAEILMNGKPTGKPLEIPVNPDYFAVDQLNR